ncbi:MAG: hypothetical protein GY800_13570, partial [Planctomycetes bacterium]|nr:hypothetical protein [Planctomycetota bacterium]
AYLVGFRELKNSSTRYYIKILVTDLCLTTVESKGEVLFTVTSYKTGKPVSNATVSIEGVDSTGFKTIFEAVTDKNGMCLAESSDINPYRLHSLKRVVVKKGDDLLVLNTKRGEQQPPAFKNNHWSSSSSWLYWVTNDPYSYENDREYRGFVCTERPIYRPGDTVFVKGYLRSLLHGNLSIPHYGDLTVNINGPGLSTSEIVPLSEYGSYDFAFVEEKIQTGEFSVTVEYDSQNEDRDLIRIASTSFRIDAYRIPKFEVKVTSPDRVPNDRPFSVNLAASYYAGGPVIEGDVRWRVAGYPYNWSVDGWENYMLSSDSRFSGSSERGQAGTFDEEMKTDQNGGASLIVQPQSVVGANPMKFVVEGTVTDVDAQTVTDSRTIITLPPYVLGLKTDRFVRGGSTVKAKLIAVSHDEKLVEGQEVSVALKKMSWNSYLQETDFARSKPRYITDEQIHLVEERTVITKNEPLELSFENCEAGVYIIECSSTDKLGRRQTLKIDLFLSGEKAVVWEKSEQQVFETVTDKNSYVPGEKAEIILKSPYQNGRALAVVEQPDGHPTYHWVDVVKGQAIFDLTITDDMIPRIPVSFMLMRARISGIRYNKNGQVVDPGKPQTVANTTWIKVKPAANRVKVKLKHNKKYTPGDTMTLNLSLTDWKGKPLSGEVALWLVDKAVLSLGKERSIDPLKEFIPDVASHITIRDSRNMVTGMLGDFETPGGDGGESDDESSEQITVRKNFKTVPYYNPSVKVDKSGKAELVIPLPDNLTRFAVRAVAVSSADKFGSAKSQILVRLPVIVQPMLPRFVRVGDTIQAGGVARVVEGSGGEGLFSLSTDGLDVLNNSMPKWSPFTFPGKKAHPVTVKMAVPAPAYTEKGELARDSVSLQMAVRKKNERGGDAFRVSIPILPDRRPVTFQQIGMVSGDSAFAFKALPEEARDNTLMRKLMVSSELPLLKVIGALRYLIEYP